MENNDSGEGMSSTEKAAIFMMTLEPQDASLIMRRLGPVQIHNLSLAMSGLKAIRREQIEFVLDSFFQEADRHSGLGIDPDSYVKDILVKAIGEDKANSVINRILIGSDATGLESLKWMDPRAVADIIRYEHPQIQAIVLTYLEPDQSADILSMFDEDVRIDLSVRIASLDSIQPKALQELNDIMEKQFHGASAGQAANVGGIKTAAEIMNCLDPKIEGPIMEKIKAENSDMAVQIEDLMFIFSNILDFSDRDIQALLREVPSEGLLLALKGADVEVQDKIFKNMSKRAAELMRDDLESKGPVKISEVEKSQKEIIATARKLADSGVISLGGKSGEQMV